MRPIRDRPVGAVLLALLCAGIGCGKGLHDLEPFACARDQSCPSDYLCLGNVCEVLQSCDPVGASCGGARPRCTLVASPVDRQRFITQCVATSGGWPERHDCDAPASGLYTAPDGCVAGTLCYNARSYVGAGDASNQCRKPCHSEGDCNPPGTHCALGLAGPQFSGLTGGTLGVCEPSCDFSGNLCPVNQHCDTLPGVAPGTGILTCRDDGAVAEGGSCASANCQAGLLCVPGISPFQTAPTCRVWCATTLRTSARRGTARSTRTASTGRPASATERGWRWARCLEVTQG